ncbi:MAG: D-alanyl-D-alanine carboxypeptidase family protein [Oscillospiraceae bacterium]|nr:D-alanyl-D-alanine carboxypeptidase family protein [Oscillospiraceae bacterium]
MEHRTQQKRRRRSGNLTGLIGLLAAVLVILVVVAVTVKNRGSSQTGASLPPARTGWQEDAAGRYYLNDDGSRASGWLELDGSRYYLGEDGILRTGRVEVGGQAWLQDTNGIVNRAGWVEYGGSRYYLKDDGSLYTGWLEAEGIRYYLNADGTMRTGWLELDGSRYYLDADGMMQTGWLDADGSRYYLNADGTVYTGWLEQDGSKYYLKEDGAMARGKLEIDGQNWFFASNGTQLYMVNPWNYIPEDYTPDLVSLSTSIASEGNKIDRICYDALLKMMSDCNKAMREQYAGTGKTIPECYIVSAYRSQAKQEANYQRMVNKYLGYGYDQAAAEKEAAKIVAVPGTSEHQLGLAADIIDTQSWNLNSTQETLPAQQWLMKNCWRYGFILRYPNGTTEVTGIIYEPWHYRYVGVGLAEEITNSGLTLEEYLDSLS